jgi:hypothetical protein
MPQSLSVKQLAMQVIEMLLDPGEAIPFVHFLKTVQPFYSNIASGLKSFEIRYNDRDFKVGDFVVLEKFPYTGAFVIKQISYMLTHDDFPDGLKPGYCVLSLNSVINEENSEKITKKFLYS